jgi:hypothetical protein
MSLWFSRLSFSFINPVSLYNSLKGVNFVLPDMILIATLKIMEFYTARNKKLSIP